MLFFPSGRNQSGAVEFVRRLVLAETDVAVDAKDGILGFHLHIFPQFVDLVDQVLYELLKRILDIGFVTLFVGMKPIAMVILFQFNEEVQKSLLKIGHSG
jgi:hypothetical protein